MQIRGQYMAVGAHRIRPLREGGRLRCGPRRPIREDYRTVQRDRVGGAIHVCAVSLSHTLGIVEMDIPRLVDGCPFARFVKFRREFTRCRGLVGRVPKFARYFHTASAHQLLQLVLAIETEDHPIARHPRRLRNGFAVHQSHVLPIDARGSERVHAFQNVLPRAGVARKMNFETVALDVTNSPIEGSARGGQRDTAARRQQARHVVTRSEVHLNASGIDSLSSDRSVARAMHVPCRHNGFDRPVRPKT